MHQGKLSASIGVVHQGNGELFGKERLEGTLDGSSRQSPEHIVNNVWDRIGNFSAGTAADDDMTCLVLRRR